MDSWSTNIFFKYFNQLSLNHHVNHCLCFFKKNPHSNDVTDKWTGLLLWFHFHRKAELRSDFLCTIFEPLNIDLNSYHYSQVSTTNLVPPPNNILYPAFTQHEASQHKRLVGLRLNTSVSMLHTIKLVSLIITSHHYCYWDNINDPNSTCGYSWSLTWING